MSGMTLVAEAQEAGGCGLWIGGSAEITQKGDVSGHQGEGLARVQEIEDDAIYLALSSFSYSGAGHGEKSADGNGNYGAIYYKGDKRLVITIGGTCSLSRAGGDNLHDGGKCTYSYGIYSEQPVTINCGANAKMTITCTNVHNGGAGIYTNGDLIIDNSDWNQKEFNVTGPDTNGDFSYGINSVGKITVGSSVRLKSKAGEATTDSIGVNCGGILNVNDGRLTATGKDATNSLGISAGGESVDFTSGFITAIQKENSNSNVIKPAKISAMVRGTAYKTSSDINGKNFVANAETALPLEYSEDSSTKHYYKVELEKIDHNHNFSYVATGATITATCNEDGCPLTDKKATLTINAPAKKSIDDIEDVFATITDENSIQGEAKVSYYKANDDGTGKNGDPLSDAPNVAGTYWAEITLGSGENSATAHVVYTIEKKKADELTEDDAKANINISYIKEAVIPSDGYEVSSSNTECEEVDSITDILDKSDSPKIYVRKAETDDTAPSNWVAISLTARGNAPEGITIEKATDSTTDDGKIKGTTSEMEYKADDSTSDWAAAAEDATTVKAGNYLVRYKATDDKPASKSAKVTVGSKKIELTDDQKPTAKTDLIYNGDSQTLVNTPTAELPENFEMQYALGEDADNAPTTGWSADIPKGTDVDTYYVWYKAVNDTDDFSTTPVCIAVEIVEDTIEETIVSLTGVTISGTAKSGQTLTAKITPADASGDITYQWNRDNAAIDGATNATYTLTDADVGKKITVSVQQTVNGTVIVEKTSSESDTVVAKDSDNKEDDDNNDDKNDDEINDDDKNNDDKNDDEIIDDDKKDDDKKDDDKKDVDEIVSPPMLKSKTTTSITIIGTEGFEYSIDGGVTWQDDTVFNGLDPDTEYSIVGRRKATDTSEAGKISPKLIVRTNAKDVVTDNEVKDSKEYGNGYIRTETNVDRDVPNNTIVNLDADLAESLMTEDEKKEVEDGAVCRLYLDVKKMDESKLSDSEKQSIAAAAKQLDDGAELGMFLDLSMFLQVGGNSARQITDLKGRKVTITIEIPEELRRTDGKPRIYYVVRFHEGKAEILAVSGSTTISFETELFSTYSVAYSDNIKPVLVTKQKVFGRIYFEKYGLEPSNYKYKFKVDDKSQKKIIKATKDMIKAKDAGSAKVALYRKAKGGSWEKIEEHEFVVEKPEITKKLDTLHAGDTAEAMSFVTNKISVNPTYFLSSKPEVAEVDFNTGKIKVLKKGSTTITIAYDNGIGAAKYKTKLVVK